MKSKIVLFNMLIVILALITFTLFGISFTQKGYYQEAKDNIVHITKVYAENFVSPERTVQYVPDSMRVTVIDAAGQVLADSEEVDVTTMENHMGREEILSAISDQPNTVIRHSDTLGKDMVYYALKVDTNDSYNFIRVSVPVESMDGYMMQTVPILIYILIGTVLLSLLASVLATNSLVKPIRQIGESFRSVMSGTYQPILPATGDDDVNGMLLQMNALSEKLKDTIASENKERERLDYILNNVSDGILVLDRTGCIETMNKNAGAIFHVESVIGKKFTILTLDELFHKTVQDCLSRSEDQVFTYTNDRGNIYLTSVRVLEKGLTIIVLSDITAVKNSEKTRSEFFANASHELKTPLTAIKGFNDIIGMKAEDETVKSFSQKIDKEVNRIIALINDMLDTMYEAMGVGLAAPQVGILKRIVVIDIGEGPIILINPEIIETSGEQTGEEGCLSLPGKAGTVTRPNYAKVKALNEDMEEVILEGEGLLARAFCHEIDHLDGKLYTRLVEGEVHDVNYEEEE